MTFKSQASVPPYRIENMCADVAVAVAQAPLEYLGRAQWCARSPFYYEMKDAYAAAPRYLHSLHSISKGSQHSRPRLRLAAPKAVSMAQASPAVCSL